MPPVNVCRLLIALAIGTTTVPAWPQSFHHAPPTSPGEGTLLPIIRPGWSTRAATPARPAAAENASPSEPLRSAEAAPRASEPEAQVTLPSHLSLNQWKRLPEPEGSQAAAPSMIASQSAPSKSATASIGAFKSPSEANRLRLAAARTVASGNLAAAEVELAAAVARFPSDARLAISLARVRESRGDWAGAAKAYGDVARLDASELRWKLRLAECRYFDGDYAEAVTVYREAEAASAPLSVSDYTRYGDAALQMNQPAVAEAAFAALARVAKEPMPQVELLRGIAALKQGKADLARNVLLRANALWPQDAALTEALRVASAAHYGNAAPVATAQAKEPTASEPQIVETSGVMPSVASTMTAEDEPTISRWRRTTAKPIGELQPAAIEVEVEHNTPAALPIDEDQSGWHAADDQEGWTDDDAELSSEENDDENADDSELPDLDVPGLLP
ncbi:MAG: tetratricopeptide repeat protein [Planctomycetota bacterium]|nr:tetratricopeptide repeat protein [Planctomycetaceae bacterium]MDQ3329406.1 tetratricopeptide repeat protein [Planctomycetota bacterium]